MQTPPVAGIGEQHLDYSILSDILVPFSRNFFLEIVAIAIRCSPISVDASIERLF